MISHLTFLNAAGNIIAGGETTEEAFKATKFSEYELSPNQKICGMVAKMNNGKALCSVAFKIAEL